MNDSKNNKTESLSVKQRIVLGAIGGVTPYIVTLLSINMEAVIKSYNFFDWLGLIVRCIVLVFLGSLVAYLHRREFEPFKVFQLGLAAPALLATVINGNLSNSQPIQTPKIISSLEISLINIVYAEEYSEPVNKGMLKAPEVSAFDRFKRGLFNSKINSTENKWFVIVGSHKKIENARIQVEKLKKKNYISEIISPYISSEYYAVIIASNVSLAEAVNVKNRALADGLPDDTYLWSY